MVPELFIFLRFGQRLQHHSAPCYQHTVDRDEKGIWHEVVLPAWKRSRGGFIILSDLSLFPVKPPSPPPPFSSCSQGNRRVEGPFPTRFIRSVFFYVPYIWLFEINVMEGVECTCRCVFRLCSHWWHCSGSAEIRSEDGKSCVTSGHRTEAVQEANGVRWCFSTECVMMDRGYPATASALRSVRNTSSILVGSAELVQVRLFNGMMVRYAPSALLWVFI